MEQIQTVKTTKVLEHQFVFKVGDSPVDLVEKLIRKGCICFASDIHIEPRESSTTIRLRVDGIIKEVVKFPKTVHEAIISRLKILAGLRTDIRHNSQDGRFKFSGTDIRLSLVPTYYGEKAVLRILAQTGDKRSFESLGFDKKVEREIHKVLTGTHGMVLVVGPTGSGKTTTLYSMLEVLVDKEISIVTIEDPIEYIIERCTQIPIYSKSGFTFAEALRSVVRQDPNVIMVGEMRDTETAKLAVQGALTGHLLLSTLHTTSAAATIPRLLDMGIEPYLVASTVRVVIAQRLVRCICNSCKVARPISVAEKEYFQYLKLISQKISVPDILYEGKGCSACGGKGFSGRFSINELLFVDEEIRKLIESRASASVIGRQMSASGAKNILEDGLEKACSGITTLAEIMRVISE